MVGLDDLFALLLGSGRSPPRSPTAASDLDEAGQRARMGICLEPLNEAGLDGVVGHAVLQQLPELLGELPFDVAWRVMASPAAVAIDVGGDEGLGGWQHGHGLPRRRRNTCYMLPATCYISARARLDFSGVARDFSGLSADFSGLVRGFPGVLRSRCGVIVGRFGEPGGLSSVKALMLGQVRQEQEVLVINQVATDPAGLGQLL